MKTSKIILSDIKDSDAWMELIYELKYDNFKKENPSLNEDELSEKFYKEIVSKYLKYGEYVKIEIIVNENLEIIGGKIL